MIKKNIKFMAELTFKCLSALKSVVITQIKDEFGTSFFFKRELNLINTNTWFLHLLKLSCCSHGLFDNTWEN